jgi:SPFH domain / Band 7 family
MFDFLSQFFQLIWDMLPRPVMVKPTERASCWLFGKYPYDIGPGPKIIWPMIMHFHVYPVVSQICETAIIAVTDASGCDWQYRLAIEYRVTDVLAYDTSSFYAQNHLEQIGGHALVNLISGRTKDQLLEIPVSRICRLIKDRIAEKVIENGIEVIAVRTVMASRCRPIFLSNAERLAVT